MVSGENGARVVSFLTPTCPPVPCCSNRPHVPAGPSIPRSVAGEPPHLQVKRARYRCKSSSLLLCPLQSLPPLSLSSSSRLLCPSLSFSQLFIHLIHVLAHHRQHPAGPSSSPSFRILSTSHAGCFPTEREAPIVHSGGICLLQEHRFAGRSVSQSTLCPAWHSP